MFVELKPNSGLRSTQANIMMRLRPHKNIVQLVGVCLDPVLTPLSFPGLIAFLSQYGIFTFVASP